MQSTNHEQALYLGDIIGVDDPEMQAAIEEARFNADIAQQVYDLRTKSGLTQRELAKLIGTSASVINRLEDADYGGRSLNLLRRIASALEHHVEVRLAPNTPEEQSPAGSIWTAADCPDGAGVAEVAKANEAVPFRHLQDAA